MWISCYLSNLHYVYSLWICLWVYDCSLSLRMYERTMNCDCDWEYLRPVQSSEYHTFHSLILFPLICHSVYSEFYCCWDVPREFPYKILSNPVFQILRQLNAFTINIDSIEKAVFSFQLKKLSFPRNPQPSPPVDITALDLMWKSI